MRGLAVTALAAAVVALSGCGGSSSSSPQLPPVQGARTFALVSFQPSTAALPLKPTTLSFAIRLPDGKPLTAYRHGPGPHTGVHLILVRDDLAYIIHRHPPVAADGTVRDRIVFPAPGTYRLVVDAYPSASTMIPQRNFQLFRTVHVAGSAPARPLPPPATSVSAGGYRFVLHGRPRLRAIQAAFLTLTVTGPGGRPARFSPWYGALAHAIFFRRGSLDYFHTHVCAPGASGCTSTLGITRVTGTSSSPGKLRVGVLLPTPGQWRLFLQTRVAGKVLTAPFTLNVSS